MLVQAYRPKDLDGSLHPQSTFSLDWDGLLRWKAFEKENEAHDNHLRCDPQSNLAKNPQF